MLININEDERWHLQKNLRNILTSQGRSVDQSCIAFILHITHTYNDNALIAFISYCWIVSSSINTCSIWIRVLMQSKRSLPSTCSCSSRRYTRRGCSTHSICSCSRRSAPWASFSTCWVLPLSPPYAAQRPQTTTIRPSTNTCAFTRSTVHSYRLSSPSRLSASRSTSSQSISSLASTNASSSTPPPLFTSSRTCSTFW